MIRPARIPDVVAALVATAREFVGIQELPGNRGILPDFANWYQIRDWRPFPEGLRGAPWCLTFQQLCGRLALGRAWPLPHGIVAVHALAQWAAEHGVLTSTPAEPGDLLCVRRAGAPDFQHVALVVARRPGGLLITIEGNTNLDGAREGVGVFALERRTQGLLDRLVRWITLLPEVGT